MTRLGYGELIRWLRIEKNTEYNRLMNAQRSDSIRITTGSNANGLTCFLESDWDILEILIDVLCVEAGINLHTVPDDIDVFQMDTRAYPGHCRLLQERQAPRGHKVIRDALCENGYGKEYLSSDLFLNESFAKRSTHSTMIYDKRAKSLNPWSIGDGDTHIVHALCCHCPSILHRWAARRRHWPSPTIVQKVVALGAFVTPQGFKGSQYEQLEWEIRFITGEAELLNNLNDTQTKVYVILNMIVKDVLRPSQREITSYVIKNIVFWQAESNRRKMFNARNLFHWLHDGLSELRKVISTKQLPHFIISERNLMEASRLEDRQQIKWVADITDMMADGPMVILRLPKIRQAIIGSPEPMLWFSERRMKLELLMLEMRNRAEQCRNENGVVDESDAILLGIKRRQREVLIEVRQRMRMEGCAVDNLSDICRSILI